MVFLKFIFFICIGNDYKLDINWENIININWKNV